MAEDETPAGSNDSPDEVVPTRSRGQKRARKTTADATAAEPAIKKTGSGKPDAAKSVNSEAADEGGSEGGPRAPGRKRAVSTPPAHADPGPSPGAVRGDGWVAGGDASGAPHPAGPDVTAPTTPVERPPFGTGAPWGNRPAEGSAPGAGYGHAAPQPGVAAAGQGAAFGGAWQGGEPHAGAGFGQAAPAGGPPMGPGGGFGQGQPAPGAQGGGRGLGLLLLLTLLRGAAGARGQAGHPGVAGGWHGGAGHVPGMQGPGGQGAFGQGAAGPGFGGQPARGGFGQGRFGPGAAAPGFGAPATQGGFGHAPGMQGGGGRGAFGQGAGGPGFGGRPAQGGFGPGRFGRAAGGQGAGGQPPQAGFRPAHPAGHGTGFGQAGAWPGATGHGPAAQGRGAGQGGFGQPQPTGREGHYASAGAGGAENFPAIGQGGFGQHGAAAGPAPGGHVSGGAAPAGGVETAHAGVSSDQVSGLAPAAGWANWRDDAARIGGKTDGSA